MSEIKKYMFFDVDGTLTDGKLYIGSNGEVFKVFNVKDGFAIHGLLPQLGVVPVVLTTRKSGIVEYRCRELEICEIYQGIKDKRAKMEELMRKWGYIPDNNGIYANVSYIGDDIMDLSCMEICGFSACPQDAADAVKAASDYVSRCKAGDGAVRDIVEWYMEHGRKHG